MMVAMRQSTQNILVVDDDPMVRRFVAMTLQRHGFSVLQADSGDDGLKSFSKHRANLAMILTDVVMPGMTGPEMVEQILAIDPGMCVMFMTGTPADATLPHRARERSQLL